MKEMKNSVELDQKIVKNPKQIPMLQKLIYIVILTEPSEIPIKVTKFS
jgi:uncharacterized protein YwgA